MKLLILGATGRTGIHLVEQALEQGFEVTALARNPQKLPIQHERLQILAGDILNEQFLENSITDQDIVLSALGPVASGKSPFLAKSAEKLIGVLEAKEVKKLIVLSSSLLFPGGGIPAKIFRWMLRNALQDSKEMESIIRDSSLKWTILRPVRLTDGKKASYRTFKNALPSSRIGISRKTVAKSMLELLAEDSSNRQILGLYSP